MDVTIMSHTHWDREWNQPFEGFRRRLVVMMDDLIQLLEREPEYGVFHFDGQSVIVEDYLAFRPEMRERLAALLAAGRIRIGPWLVMPDEAMPSGESLVRNLQVGHAICRQWHTEPLRCGYVTDIFGHTAQLPQILAGFGIHNALLARGLGDYFKTEFCWVGADGTRILGLKRDEDRTYSDFYFACRWPFYGRELDEAELVRRFGEHLAYLQDRALTEHILMMDGVDNIDAEARLPQMLDTLRAAYPDVSIRQGTIEDYVNGMEPSLRALPELQGELRQPGKAGMNNLVLANVLSSRVHLKQYNQYLESLLTQWAEPFVALSARLGGGEAPGFLEQAWRHLLINTPHDSIGGCSMTEVHRDMMFRYDQCRYIAGESAEKALAFLAARFAPVGQYPVVLFNPQPQPFRGMVRILVDLPAHPGAPLDLELRDPQGSRIPYQLLGVRRNQNRTLLFKELFPQFKAVDEYELLLEAELPALGAAVYGVDAHEPEQAPWGQYSLTDERRPVRYPGSLAVGSGMAPWGTGKAREGLPGGTKPLLDNGILRVGVQADGSLAVVDLRTGRAYADLLSLEDEGDVGDGWIHTPPLGNEKAALARLDGASLVFDGPLAAQLRIDRTLSVPAAIRADGLGRARERAEIAVTAYVTLHRGGDTLDISLVVDNTARDHRLRTLFPTDSAANHWYTTNAFDLYRRPVGRRDTSAYRELDADVWPNHGVVAIGDGDHGFTLMNQGLYEASLREDRRTIALTLLRATAREVQNEVHDGGQVLGQHTFNLALRFTPNLPQAGELWNRWLAFRAGIRAVQVERMSGELGVRHGFVEVCGENLVLSALRPSQGGIILRLFNPSGEPARGRVKLAGGISQAKHCTLNEEIGADLPLNGAGELELALEPKKIITVWIA